MKKFSFLLAVIFSLVALPPLAGAKDKDKDKKKHESDDGKKDWKVMRDKVRELKEQSDRLQNSVRTTASSRSVQQNADAIGGEVNRVCRQFDSDNYDRSDLKGKISVLMSDIDRVRQQMEYDRQRRGAYDYQPRGGYDYKHRGGFYDR